MANFPQYNPYLQQYSPQPYMQQMPQATQMAQPAQIQQVQQQPQPMMQQPIQQTPVYQIRPVTSDAEIYAAQIDFNGAPLFGWDMARGCIYMKQFNVNTGSADVTVFRREMPRQEPQQQYVTMQQLEERLAEIERRYSNGQSNADASQYNTAGADGESHARRRQPNADRGPDGAA